MPEHGDGNMSESTVQLGKLDDKDVDIEEVCGEWRSVACATVAPSTKSP